MPLGTYFIGYLPDLSGARERNHTFLKYHLDIDG
jgi:hypothetical protein